MSVHFPIPADHGCPVHAIWDAEAGLVVEPVEWIDAHRDARLRAFAHRTQAIVLPALLTFIAALTAVCALAQILKWNGL